MTHKFVSILLLGTATLLGAQVASAEQGRPGSTTTFSISIESVTNGQTLVLPDGSRAKAPISPGLYLVSRDKHALFRVGTKAGGTPLERLAEDGDPQPFVKALNRDGKPAKPFLHDQSFTVRAKPGERFHFAVMFAQSNDLFYAPQDGIALFDSAGKPVSGEFTSMVVLWDAGTEVNQAPGAGPDQAPRQAKPNTGADEHGVIRRVNDGFVYPATAEVIRVTITPQGAVAGSLR